jgi:hypothetical protein
MPFCWSAEIQSTKCVVDFAQTDIFVVVCNEEMVEFLRLIWRNKRVRHDAFLTSVIEESQSWRERPLYMHFLLTSEKVQETDCRQAVRPKICGWCGAFDCSSRGAAFPPTDGTTTANNSSICEAESIAVGYTMNGVTYRFDFRPYYDWSRCAY